MYRFYHFCIHIHPIWVNFFIFYPYPSSRRIRRDKKILVCIFTFYSYVSISNSKDFFSLFDSFFDIFDVFRAGFDMFRKRSSYVFDCLSNLSSDHKMNLFCLYLSLYVFVSQFVLSLGYSE